MITAICVKLNNDGWDSYEELELGKTYEVDYAIVDRCRTDVYLKGMPRSYNSVCFRFYKDNKAIDIVEEFKDSYYRKYRFGCFHIIKQILEETLPDSVNGIHIKYDLREVPSLAYYDQTDCVITIMPVEIKCEDAAVSMRIASDALPVDFDETSLAYKHLQKQIEEMLMMYIRNIKKVDWIS